VTELEHNKMPPYRLNLLFSGVNLNDDETYDALANLPNVMWRSQADLAFASAAVDASSALKAADDLIRAIASAVPSARPLRLDEDLVSISDIAERIGVTREAVRNWANGTRKAGFPLPRGIVGDAIKVWAWSDVDAWAQANLMLGKDERYPSAHDVALINALIEDARDRQATTAAAAASWTEASNLVPSAASTVAVARSPRAARWTHSRLRLSVVQAEVRVAA
jgi:hypothetical protein